jgi:carboxymethylenebutenolidase
MVSFEVPVRGPHGGADSGIPVDTAENATTLKAAGSESELAVYPDVPNAINSDDRPSYRKETAGDGWKRAPGSTGIPDVSQSTVVAVY